MLKKLNKPLLLIAFAPFVFSSPPAQPARLLDTMPSRWTVPTNCEEAIAFELRRQRSLYWQNLRVIAILRSHVADLPGAVSTVTTELAAVAPTPVQRDRLVGDAEIAIERARASAFCQRGS